MVLPSTLPNLGAAPATISFVDTDGGGSNFPALGNRVVVSGSTLVVGASTQMVGQFIYFDQTSVTTVNISVVVLGMDGFEFQHRRGSTQVLAHTR